MNTLSHFTLRFDKSYNSNAYKTKHNKLCQDILGLDTKVRFAGVCDNTGEIRFGGQRKGIKNLRTPEETQGVWMNP